MGEEELDRLLREAVRTAAAGRGRATDHSEQRIAEAERAYQALSGDDAPRSAGPCSGR